VPISKSLFLVFCPKIKTDDFYNVNNTHYYEISNTHTVWLKHLPPPGFPTAGIQTRAPADMRQKRYHWTIEDMLNLETDRWT
jgi:hypothetical protein